MTDWYNYDKDVSVNLPPAGTKCLVWYSGEWRPTYIVGINSNWGIVFEVDFEKFDTPYDSYAVCPNTNAHFMFKPTPIEIEKRKAETQKQRVVRQAFADAADCHRLEDILADLYDKGYLKLPD